MKFITIALLVLVQIGCSSSTNNEANPLVGSWRSNCHERIDATGKVIPTVRLVYITEYTFNVTTMDQAITNLVEQTSNCTVGTGVPYVIPHTYTLGEEVITTDGVEAKRITLNSDYNSIRQPIKTTTESIYRVTGVELNFGDYIHGEIPTLDYATTYIKQ